MIRIDTYQQSSVDCCGAFVVEGFNSTHRHQVSALFEVLEREPFTILIRFFLKNLVVLLYATVNFGVCGN